MGRNKSTRIIVAAAKPPAAQRPKKKKNRKSKKGMSVSPDPYRALGSLIPHVSDYHYAASLLNPFGVFGARIPDTDQTPSFCTRTIMRFSISAHANGTPSTDNCTGFLLNLVPGTLINSGNILFTTTAGSAPSTVQFSTGLVAPNGTTIGALTSTARIVSCGAAIMPTQVISNLGGTMTGFSVGQKSTSVISTGFVNTPLTTITNQPTQRKCAVAWNDPCSIAYAPSGGPVYHTYRPAADNTGEGQLGFFAQNLPPTASFDVVVVINLECTPLNASQGVVDVKPSPANFRALEIASNLAGSKSIFHAPVNDIFDATAGGGINIRDDAGAGTNWAMLMDMITSTESGQALGRVRQGIQNVLNASSLAYGVANLASGVVGRLTGGYGSSGYNRQQLPYGV